MLFRSQSPPARAGPLVRPGQDAVGLPDLDRDDVTLSEDSLLELSVLLPRDLDPVAVNERGLHHAVDVAGEGGLLGVERLGLHRARENRAERDTRSGADERRRQEEDAQERERTLEIAPAPKSPHDPVHGGTYRPRSAWK